MLQQKHQPQPLTQPQLNLRATTHITARAQERRVQFRHVVLRWNKFMEVHSMIVSNTTAQKNGLCMFHKCFTNGLQMGYTNGLHIFL